MDDSYGANRKNGTATARQCSSIVSAVIDGLRPTGFTLVLAKAIPRQLDRLGDRFASSRCTPVIQILRPSEFLIETHAHTTDLRVPLFARRDISSRATTSCIYTAVAPLMPATSIFGPAVRNSAPLIL
jgi:hypothetical protein